VQEDQQRPAGAFAADPFVLDAHAPSAPVELDELDRHVGLDSC
jgi:hypothetical protein